MNHNIQHIIYQKKHKLLYQKTIDKIKHPESFLHDMILSRNFMPWKCLICDQIFRYHSNYVKHYDTNYHKFRLQLKLFGERHLIIAPLICRFICLFIFPILPILSVYLFFK